MPSYLSEPIPFPFLPLEFRDLTTSEFCAVELASCFTGGAAAATSLFEILLEAIYFLNLNLKGLSRSA